MKQPFQASIMLLLYPVSRTWRKIQGLIGSWVRRNGVVKLISHTRLELLRRTLERSRVNLSMTGTRPQDNVKIYHDLKANIAHI